MTAHDDLTALSINTCLKRSSETSHTQTLMDVAIAIMKKQGVRTNLMHLTRLLKDAGGVPTHGTQRTARDMGQRFDHPNPEYR